MVLYAGPMPPSTPTLSDVIDGAIETALGDVYTALPGRVVAFNSDACTANIQPMIKQLYTREDGTEFAATLPVIPNVPVMFPGSGPKNGLTFPVKAGDTVLLVCCSVSLDAWKLSEGNRLIAPKNFKPHALNNAVAIVGLRTMPAADAAASTFTSSTSTILHAEDLCLGDFTINDEDRVMRKEDATRFMSGLALAINTATAISPQTPITAAAVYTLTTLQGGLSAVGWLNGVYSIVKAVKA